MVTQRIFDKIGIQIKGVCKERTLGVGVNHRQNRQVVKSTSLVYKLRQERERVCCKYVVSLE